MLRKSVPVTGFKYDCEESLKPFIQLILDGEYDIPYIDGSQAVQSVLDLGANIGSFSYWAAIKFPASKIYAYEPDPINCEKYRKHMEDSGIPSWRYELIEAAVTSSPDPTISMYRSSINSGMTSIREGLAGANAEKFAAPTFNPRNLPECDMLKADTEGCEIDIISNYLATHKAPTIISFEFHFWEDRHKIEELLRPDYHLATGNVCHMNLGTLNYVNKKCIVFV